MDEYSNFYEVAFRLCQSWYMDHPTVSHPPMLLTTLGEDITLTNCQDLDLPEMFELHRRSLDIADCAILVSEAWRTPGQKGGFGVEVVMFNLLSPARQALMMCEIDRTTGAITKAPFKWLPDNTPISGPAIRPTKIH
jgi:hypothetical protein